MRNFIVILVGKNVNIYNRDFKIVILNFFYKISCFKTNKYNTLQKY
jgi:hypothetical protein